MRFVHDTQEIPKDASSDGLKVIAAGLWRCATSSLQITFERVLSGPGHKGSALAPSLHGAYIMPDVSLMQLFCTACRELDRDKRQQILRRIFDGYNATSGWPGFVFADDLIDMYPDAKVVLNLRSNLDEWEKSVASTLQFYSTKTYLILTYWVAQSYWHHQCYIATKELFKRRYGVDSMFTIEAYEAHRKWVHRVTNSRGKQCLEWAPKDGWTPLCRFLDVDIPEQAFPASNDRGEMQKLMRYLICRGILAWLAVMIILVSAGIVLVVAFGNE